MRYRMAILGGVLCFSPAAKGDSSHRRDQLVGGKAAMMGAAYTATADSPEAVYYNPAGLTASEDNKLSANGTAFYSKDIRYIDAVNGQDFVKETTSTFPNFIGTSQRMGRFGFGYGIVTTDSRSTKQNDYFDHISDQDGFANSYSRFHHESTTETFYGAGGAVKLGNFSLGSSAFYYTQKNEMTLHQMVSFTGGMHKNVDQSQTATAKGLYYIVGILWDLKDFTLGFSHHQAKEMGDEALITQDFINYSPADANLGAEHTTATNLAVDHRIPNTTSLGLAYRPAQWLTLDFDSVFYAPSRHKTIQKYDYPSNYDLSFGIDMNLGLLVIRSGIFTNHDLSTQINKADVNHLDHIDFQGISFGIGRSSQALETSVGIVIQYGYGDSQIITDSAKIIPVRSTSRMGILNLAYKL